MPRSQPAEPLRPRHTTRQRREEGVHAHLHAHPSAQRDCPATHIGIVEGRGVASDAGAACGSGMLIRDARDCGIIASKDAGGSRRAGDPADERPAARDSVQCACAAHRRMRRFLDLYAGSGAVGIEALSRGAAQVTFVERAATGSEGAARESGKAWSARRISH